jgi:hypothetical protein
VLRPSYFPYCISYPGLAGYHDMNPHQLSVAQLQRLDSILAGVNTMTALLVQRAPEVELGCSLLNFCALLYQLSAGKHHTQTYIDYILSTKLGALAWGKDPIAPDKFKILLLSYSEISQLL